MLTFFTLYLPTHPRYRCFILCIIFALSLLCVVAYLTHKDSQENTQYMARLYGETLVKLAAEQVSASVFHKDSISLQAIARYITDQNMITSVIIYDISDSIMAQASDATPLQRGQEQRYKSLINSGGNRIGSITLGIIPSENIHPQSNILLAIIALLLLAVMMITYIKYRTTISKPKDNTEDPLPPSVVETMTQEKVNDGAVEISLLLQISNIDFLYQYLNGELRSQQLDKFDDHLQQVAALYNGKIIAAAVDSFLLLFTDQSDRCIQQALYCGELILKLNQQTEESIITLNGFIQQPQKNLTHSSMISTVRKSLLGKKNQCFIESSLIKSYELEEKLELEEIQKTSGAMLIKGFTGSDATLLEDQLKLLKHNTKRTEPKDL
ncbi:hypothetical protein AB835_04495 [Candidatus Endobugula sertula]|uniref:GGDEF domain-containing protein n=1 Tax=Candidatus Endobugula sertula TaxID=62101 RepID=A0A1D2QRY7_9GAMM|nr:hypothetical protein AB835_04495 [Candidatus Endobugula sertula]